MPRLIRPIRIARLFTLVIITASCLTLFTSTAFAQEEPQAEVETETITETATVAEPGVLIVSVTPESAAAAAGIVRGDIVLRIGETEVNDAAALREAISALAPDEAVTVTLLHGDDELDVAVTLGNRDGSALLGVLPYVDPMMLPELDEEDITIERPDLAMPHEGWFERPFLRPNAPWREKMGEEMGERMGEMMGAMTVTLTIADVITGSPAADAGLQISDTIVAINGEAPANPRTLVSAVNELAPGDTLTLTVQTADGAEETVAIALGAHPDNADRAYLGIRFNVEIQINRQMDGQMNGPRGERRMPRLRFFLPRFLPHFEERQQQRQEFEQRFQWREDQQDEDTQDAMPNGPMRWRFERDGQNFDFTLPVPDHMPGRIFRWITQPNDEVVIVEAVEAVEAVVEQLDHRSLAPEDVIIEAVPQIEDIIEDNDVTILTDVI